MKHDFLEKFEKLYFNASRYFWHILTGIAALALIVGIFIFLWGVLPAMKPRVKKPELPAPISVELAQVHRALNPQEENKSRVIEVSSTSEQAEEKDAQPAESTSKEELTYLATLDSLKALLPADDFQWENDGQWYYGRWRIRSYGILHRLDQVYHQLGADDFQAKTQLLNAYATLFTKFSPEERKQIHGDVFEFAKSDVEETIISLEALADAAALYTDDKPGAFSRLAAFGLRNPRDGQKFIEYTNSIMPKFDSSIRETMLVTLIQSYYNYFNLIQKQEEATNLFLDIQSSFAAEDQIKALVAYYQLYNARNKARHARIEQLEAEHQTLLAEAESELMEKKGAKLGYRLLALKLIGGSIVFIAFLALFLVVLSIQRNIKMLKENLATTK